MTLPPAASPPGRAARRQAYLIARAAGETRSGAAAFAGVSPSTVRRWSRTDPAFRDAETAVTTGALDALEAEAVRRALHGVEKPVFRGGEQVATVTELSDGLLTLLLKQRWAERETERAARQRTGLQDMERLRRALYEKLARQILAPGAEETDPGAE
ncbi:hypothetical protein [Gimibacter soli]|uniref:Uncharacterized protein n=1 Tax=Gimibacter soli TaxID=3024400 RepID=A0AAF0BM58_9PROT|nr:hypothetical protein [Gimibacter soli]WCL55082.1 hypothetical protein PH603_04830 [Gimibacter soli]